MALIENWRSEVKTPLRLNGRRIRSASTPSIRSSSTMPSGLAVRVPKRTPLLTRSTSHTFPVSHACRTAWARKPCKSPVISRASNSTSPAPINGVVWRSLENVGSTVSNSALSKPSDTKASATKSPAPPIMGSLWQPAQELASGPLVRVKAGLAPRFRLVGRIACVALGRPAPSAVVNLALNKILPRSISAGIASAPARATVSKSTWLVKTFSSQLALLATSAPPHARMSARIYLEMIRIHAHLAGGSESGDSHQLVAILSQLRSGKSSGQMQI